MKTLPLRLLALIPLVSALASCSARGPAPPLVNDYRTTSPPVRITPQSVCVYQNGIMMCGDGGGSNSPCEIDIQEVATTPLDRGRLTIGVGEQVDVTVPAGGEVFVSGDGSANSSYSPVTVTANATSGTITVSSSDRGKICSKNTVSLNVITPSSVYYAESSGPYHTVGQANIGMYSNVYVGPDSVSFQFAHFSEAMAYFVGSGSWLCQTNQPHEGSVGDYPLGAVVPGYGTQVNGYQDWAYTGACGGNQIQASNMSVTIPTQYRLATECSTCWHNIGSVVQSATETAAGVLSISKDHATVSSAVNNATNPAGWIEP